MAFAIPLGKMKGAPCTEENELLSDTSIKMNDAPFGRSDSDDDIVEDYDDAITFQTPCLRNRTPLEKVLLCLLVVFLVVIISLAVGLTRPQIVPVTKYCKSSACVKAAGSLLSNLDWSVDPCDDFYKFSCGQWLKTQPIPQGYYHWDRFQELSGHNLYMLSNLIDSNSQSGEAFEKTRTFYRSCMATDKAQRETILDQFMAFANDAVWWNLSRHDNISEWNFMVALEHVHGYGAWPFFQLSVEVDERDPTKLYIIKIDVGETVLPSDIFPTASTVQDTNSTNTTLPPSVKSARELQNIFLDETVHLFMSFGVTEAEAVARAKSMLEIENFLASVSAGHNHIHDQFKLYNVMPISVLQYNYSMINWIQHFSALGFHVTGDTEVVVMHPDYMSTITHFLRDYYHGSEDKKM